MCSSRASSAPSKHYRRRDGPQRSTPRYDRRARLPVCPDWHHRAVCVQCEPRADVAHHQVHDGLVRGGPRQRGGSCGIRAIADGGVLGDGNRAGAGQPRCAGRASLPLLRSRRTLVRAHPADRLAWNRDRDSVEQLGARAGRAVRDADDRGWARNVLRGRGLQQRRVPQDGSDAVRRRAKTPNGRSAGYQRRPLASRVAKCQRDPADSGSTPGLKLGWRAVIAALPASMVSASVTMMPATDSRILARRTFQPPRALDESRATGCRRWTRRQSRTRPLAAAYLRPSDEVLGEQPAASPGRNRPAYDPEMEAAGVAAARKALLEERSRLRDELAIAIEAPGQMTYGSQAAAATHVFEQ